MNTAAYFLLQQVWMDRKPNKQNLLLTHWENATLHHKVTSCRVYFLTGTPLKVLKSVSWYVNLDTFLAQFTMKTFRAIPVKKTPCNI